MGNKQLERQDHMQLHMDFSEKTTVLPEQHTWATNPVDGISRVLLEQGSLESGHTTSLVRYAPGSLVSLHTYPLGEELFVLEGVYSDEDGDHPAGTYIRNPRVSGQRSVTQAGCVLFEKLNQFHPDDCEHVVNLEEQRQWLQGLGNLKVLPLHDFQTQSTALVYWPENEVFQPHRHWGGEEMLVLKGEFCDEYGKYPKYSWIRSPHLSTHTPFVAQETLILVKVGHLPQGKIAKNKRV